MFTNDFSQSQVFFLTAGGICFLISIVFHVRNKEVWAVAFLLAAALSVNLFASLLDPFLNLWDERFHALVAKNLLYHPLKPTLYDDPVVSMAYDRWDRYHIWLHKQPLFLWQIAVSFKLFGVSEFTLRLPSAILGAFLVLIGYRSGSLLVSRNTGFITGTLLISSVYFLELIAGRQEVDHNDVSFVVYISLSIWALIEYHYSGRRRWILLIGLFSGMAILCKWLAGLLVYAGWFILVLQERKLRFREFVPLLQALLVTVIVALPWQVLTFVWYPEEARQAFDLNSRHIFQPVDGHRGDFWYHFNMTGLIYGKIPSYLIIPSVIILYFRMNTKKLYLPILLMIAGVYLFFSLATTKMPSFVLIVSLLVFISLASLIVGGLELLRKIRMPTFLFSTLVFIVLLAIFIMRFDIEKIQFKHTLRNPENIETRWLTHNQQVFKTLQLPANAVMFNVKGRHYIEAMFYTGLPAYNFIPSEEQYLDMKRKERIIAVFQPEGSDLPGYLNNDASVIVLPDQLMGWD
jgi:4-amino-4-deoxy-L-arabinose transferase